MADQIINLTSPSGDKITLTVSMQAATPPVVTPPVTTPPVTTPPVTTPPVTTPPSGSITNGKQLTRDMCLPRVASLKTMSGTVRASSLGATASGIHFTGTFVPDAVIFLADCQFDAQIDTGPYGKIVTLQRCLISPPSPGDWAINGTVTATRCVLEGNSDGVRFDGTTIIECFVRTRQQSSADHNDGVQAYLASSGGSILRCNIDVRPIGGGGSVNGCLFFADGSKGEVVIRDNYLLGGNWTLRLHESMTYRVTGNVIEKGTYIYGPVNNANMVSGAIKEWANNTLSDGTAVANPS